MERQYQVYRDYQHGSIAIDSVPVLGRGGLLTRDEARRLADLNPGSWIGTFDGVKIVRVERSTASARGYVRSKSQ